TLSAVVARFKASTTADVAALIGRFEPAGTTSLQSAAGVITAPSSPAFRPNLSTLLKPRVEPDKPSEVASPPVPTSAPPAIPPPAAVPVTPPSEAVAPVSVSPTPPEPSTSGTAWSNLLKRAERLGQSERAPAIPT